MKVSQNNGAAQNPMIAPMNHETIVNEITVEFSFFAHDIDDKFELKRPHPICAPLLIITNNPPAMQFDCGFIR